MTRTLAATMAQNHKHLLALYEQGDHKKTLALALAILAKQPLPEQALTQQLALAQKIQSLHIAGICQRKLADFEQSVDLLTQALRLDPTNKALVDSVISSLQRWIKEPLTIQPFEALMRLPTLTTLVNKESLITEQVLNELCKRCLNSGQLQKALAYSQEGVQRFEHNHSLHYLHSLSLKNLGHLPKAVVYAQRALQLRLAEKTTVITPPINTGFNTKARQHELWQLLVSLKNDGVHAFPTAGTLLGLVREKGLLPSDKDIDIGVPFSEMNKAIACLQTLGWQEVKGLYSLSNPRQLQHPNSRTVVDFCGYQKDNNSGKWLGGLWMNNIPMAWNRITEFDTLNLSQAQSPLGLIWWLDNPAQFLQALYGDWQTPDAEFDTVICAKNLQGFSLMTQCYGLHRIYSNWCQAYVARALKLVKSLLQHQPTNELMLVLNKHFDDTLAERFVSKPSSQPNI